MVLLRSVTTLIGVTASASAGQQSGHRTKARRTSRYSSADRQHAGQRLRQQELSPLKPNSFALTAWTHSPTGGLSTVTKPPASNEAKKKSASSSACS